MAQKWLSRLKISIWGKFLRISMEFLKIFGHRWLPFNLPYWDKQLCFYSMAQKWLSRLLPSTPYLPYSGPFRLVGASWGKP